MCDPLTEFTCHDGQCVPLQAHCNGWPECLDRSDESPDTCSNPPQGCAPDEWQCPGGACLDNSKVCDGKDDCDLKDELSCSKSTQLFYITIYLNITIVILCLYQVMFSQIGTDSNLYIMSNMKCSKYRTTIRVELGSSS